MPPDSRAAADRSTRSWLSWVRIPSGEPLFQHTRIGKLVKPLGFGPSVCRFEAYSVCQFCPRQSMPKTNDETDEQVRDQTKCCSNYEACTSSAGRTRKAVLRIIVNPSILASGACVDPVMSRKTSSFDFCQLGVALALRLHWLAKCQMNTLV